MKVNVVSQGRMGKGVHMSTSVLIVQIDAGLIKIRVCKSRCWMLVGHTTRVFFFSLIIHTRFHGRAVPSSGYDDATRVYKHAEACCSPRLAALEFGQISISVRMTVASVASGASRKKEVLLTLGLR